MKYASPLKKETVKGVASPFCGQKGFTLLNVLVSLMVYMFIAGTMASIFHLFLSPERNGADIHPREWTITAEQILKECRNSVDIRAGDDHQSLEMTNRQGAAVRYEKYQTVIRKRVTGKGHVPLLQHVKHMRFVIEDHLLILEATSLSGKSYRTSIPLYHM
ncbi:competence type IV pilus minor pilin ComGF [Bacillus paralicheniformis]|uniref:competence type IV pilus minor pilin ComGF n=2 Tax=Bacillaceae TaxID=186817 RepID=UPI001F4CB4D1|nr:competence type IV pilus minor pilin ComGF [Bacillus paralicheniformis]MCM3421931.1 ComGF family competence protein [Bacillus paralicheniformis]MEC1868879.1 competence type IV pilus minor pilin ComGF [Bacillus paralicheniformis]